MCCLSGSVAELPRRSQSACSDANSLGKSFQKFASCSHSNSSECVLRASDLQNPASVSEERVSIFDAEMIGSTSPFRELSEANKQFTFAETTKKL